MKIWVAGLGWQWLLISLTCYGFGLDFRKVFSLNGAMDVVVPERKDQYGKVRKISASSFFSAGIILEDGFKRSNVCYSSGYWRV